MALEIPAYNLFMMCESLRREAFAPLPAGYSVRLCREDELETWMALNAESPESFPFLQDYYQRVYQNQGKLFFEKCLFVCDSQDTPVGTCFLWKAYGKITTLHWLKVLPQLEQAPMQKLVLVTVGLADPTAPENVAHIRASLQKQLPGALYQKAQFVHLRGGIDYSRLNFKHRAMMWAMVQML